MSRDENELIANLAIVAVSIIPLLGLWNASLVSVHRKRDPARLGTIWLRIAFPLWIISLVLELTHIAMYFNYEYGNARSYNGFVGATLLNVSGLFESLAQVAILVTFVELGRGFLLASGAPSRLWHPIFRGVLLGWSLVLFLLAFALFGVNQDVWDGGGSRNSTLNKRRTLAKLTACYTVLSWIPSLVVLGFAVYVAVRAQRSRVTGVSSIFFLIASVAAFVRYMYLLVIYFLCIDPLRAAGPLYCSIEIGYIVTPVFSVIGMYLVLNMLYSVVRQRAEAGGLWSAPQQEQPMMYAAGEAGYEAGQGQVKNNAPMPYVPISSNGTGGVGGGDGGGYYAPQMQQQQQQPQMMPSYSGGGGQAQYGAEAPYISEAPSNSPPGHGGYGYAELGPNYGGQQPVYQSEHRY